MARLILFVASIVSFVAVPALSENDIFKIMPESNELLLKVGASQSLNCTVTASDDNVQLVWTLPIVDGRQVTDRVTTWSKSHGTSGRITRENGLQIVSFDLANAGEYKCSLIKNNTIVDSKVILVSAAGENKTQPVFKDGSTEVTLSCELRINKSISDLTWLKVGYSDTGRSEQKLSDLKDSSRFKEVDENSSLIITTPTQEDAGLYIARFTFIGLPTPYDCEVEFQAAPVVQDFDKAKNLIEGDKMELQCIVKGHPYSVVTWYKGSDRVNYSDSDSRHQILESFSKDHTVRLIIKSVEFSDEGDYTCEAYSARFNETSRKTLTVRVKDKLAALWPFLGIVGEVVVLCTIIFIYEKRRNKQVQLEEKAAEEVDGSATDKKEGLRHRTTNNPTA